MVHSDHLTVQLREIAWSMVMSRREPPGGIHPADPNPSRSFGASSLELRAGALGLLHAYIQMIKVLQRRIDVTVEAALHYGASYGQVAVACGVSRQAARQRWLRHHRPEEPTAQVAGGPPDRDEDGGTDEATRVSQAGGTLVSASLPPTRPRAGIPGAKIRVYELAKEFGVESKAVLARLQEMGEFVRSASSTIEAPMVRRLRAEFGTQPSE